MENQITIKLIDYLQKTEDFVLKESPEIFQEALKYSYISNLMSCFVCVTAILILTGIFYYFFYYPKLDQYGSREMVSTFGCFLSPFIIFVLFMQLILSIDNIIKINVSPKYFLLSLFLDKVK